MANKQPKEDSSDSDYDPSDSEDLEENMKCRVCGMGNLEDWDAVNMKCCKGCGDVYCLDCAKTRIIEKGDGLFKVYLCHNCFGHHKNTHTSL